MKTVIMGLFRKRRIRKNADEILKASRHFRNMRGDLMSEEDLLRLESFEADLETALQGCDLAEIQEAAEKLESRLNKLAPYVSSPAFRENLEVIVVAVVVAMGFRSYFIQPFKIPTGSMQPTLNGIRYIASTAEDGPTLLDRQPLRFFKWLITGDTYVEYRANSSGIMMPLYDPNTSGEKGYVRIGSSRQKLPAPHYASLKKNFGEYVEKGELLWEGTRKAGDHVFVDRVSWNFRQPHRKEVSVFITTGIQGLPQNIHYIKRMVAVPGDYVSIREGKLCIDRVPVEDPRSDSMHRYPDAKFHPYSVTRQGWGQGKSALMFTQDTFPLSAGQYFMLGDNAASSQDSRYWGAAPQENLVGPAWIVYWPFTKHWGKIK